MKICLRLFLISLIAIFFALSFMPESSAQRRDAFIHSTADHKKLDCNSCHKNPTPNWVTARGYPDVVDYPGHTACNSCHSGRQFLALCNSCHVSNITPRRAPRFAFPRPGSLQEFNTVFPHNVHQDIIAANVKETGVAVAHFVNASFTAARIARIDDDKPQFNNCAICHQTSTAAPKLIARTPAGQKPLGDALIDSFAPKALFFKDNPSGHATCFACHFQSVQPIGTNCAGCHSPAVPYRDTAEVKRYSFKFDHEQKEHSIRDCMTCHVRISQNSDLKTMVDADVPFLACVSCHSDKISEEAGKRVETLSGNQPAFQCNYCHTPAVGRFPMPPSHEKR